MPLAVLNVEDVPEVEQGPRGPALADYGKYELACKFASQPGSHQALSKCISYKYYSDYTDKFMNPPTRKGALKLNNTQLLPVTYSLGKPVRARGGP